MIRRLISKFPAVLTVYIVLGALICVYFLAQVFIKTAAPLRDLDSFLTASSLVFTKDANIYDFEKSRKRHPVEMEMRSFMKPLLEPMAEIKGVKSEMLMPGFVFPYVYPPLLAYVVYPLSLLDKQNAMFLWLALMMLIAFCLPFVARRWLTLDTEDADFKKEVLLLGMLALGFLAFSLEQNVFWRQVNPLIILLLLLTLAFEKDKPLLAAFFFALAVLIKMSPAVFGLYFLYRRRWRFLFYAAGWTALMAGVLFILDWRQWMNFLEALPNISEGSRMIRGLIPVDSPGNLSLKGFTSRVTPLKGRTLDMVAAGLTLLLVAFALYREKNFVYKKDSRLENYWLLYRINILALLASPMTWYSHYVILFPAILILFYYLRESVHTRNIKLAAGFVFFILIGPYSIYMPQLKLGGWLMFGILNSMNFYALLLLFFLPDILLYLERKRSLVIESR